MKKHTAILTLSIGVTLIYVFLFHPDHTFAQDNGTLFDQQPTISQQEIEFEEQIHHEKSNQIIVRYKEEYHSSYLPQTILPGYLLDTQSITNNIEILTLKDSNHVEAAIHSFLEDDRVLSVEKNVKRDIFNLNIDDPYISSQWSLTDIQALHAWNQIYRLHKSIVVAVLDTGINSDHPDLQSRISPHGYNFTSNDNNTTDVLGHGTLVSGIIAAQTNNGIGIAGVAGNYDVQILPLKVCGPSGCYSSEIISAIQYAIDQQVDVINISLGGAYSSETENYIIQKAIQSGIVVIAAAGNQGDSSYFYPASYDNVISVGSISSNHVRSSFSNFNNKITVVAPGEAILTTTNNGNYSARYGTSFSSPIVAGIAAVMKGIDPEMDASDFKQLLSVTSKDLGTVGRDIYYGFGSVDMNQAVTKALSTTRQKQGNLPGNINHSGYYATSGDWIYFANENDQYRLYKIHKEGTSIQKLSNDSVQYLNVFDDVVYYSNVTDGYKLYKIGADGSARQKLNDDASFFITVVDGYVYYSNQNENDHMYKISINGTQKTKLNDDRSNSLHVWQGWVYYQNLSDESSLYRISIDGTWRSKIMDDRMWFIQVSANEIFYQNESDGDKIYKVNTNGSSRTKLNNDNSWYLHAVGDWIFYSNRDDGNKIYKIRTDGTSRSKINEDASRNLYVVGDWIYYVNRDDNNRTYQIRFDGSGRQKSSLNALHISSLVSYNTHAHDTSLRWRETTGATSYAVYQNGELISTVSSSSNSHQILNLIPGVTYEFSVIPLIDTLEGTGINIQVTTATKDDAAIFFTLSGAVTLADVDITDYRTFAELTIQLSDPMTWSNGRPVVNSQGIILLANIAADGHFEISGIPAGTYGLIINAKGYGLKYIPSFTLTTHTTMSPIELTPGDVDQDGRIDAKDLIELMERYRQHSAGFEHMDFDRNGTIDAQDMLQIMKRYNLQISELIPWQNTNL